MSLTIEAGKFYRTRGGMKVKISDMVGGYGIGFFITDAGPCPCTWEINGRYRYGLPTESLNIVALWIDPPMVDWDKFPKHIVAVFKMPTSHWRCATFIPTPMDNDGWDIVFTGRYHFSCELEPEEHPSFAGDWRNSLVIRPGDKKHITQAVHDVKKREATLSSNHPDHTPGPWREGTAGGIVADAPTGFDDDDNIRAYGGHLVCESVWTKGNRSFIAAAPELYEACKAAMKVLHNRFTADEMEAKSKLHSAVCSAEGIPF